ncbi:UNVERIFIED_CONTAM: hypothetical protein FKN15_033433 [Acipenser sinensis]
MTELQECATEESQRDGRGELQEPQGVRHKSYRSHRESRDVESRDRDPRGTINTKCISGTSRLYWRVDSGPKECSFKKGSSRTTFNE